MIARIVMFLLVLVVVVAGNIPAAQAQDPTRDPLADLLAYVPDTPAARTWLTYGDVAAWHTSWGVPRPLNVDTLNLLPAVPRGYWMMLLPRQTMPPQSLGLDSLLADDQRAFYGFDFFQVDRVLDAGEPPDELTVLEHNADPEEIAVQLLESGYTAEPLANDWTLYSILGDYEVAIGSDAAAEMPLVGTVGRRNRIALSGQRMIIARATGNVTAALDAAAGTQPTLLDDSAYAALVDALHAPLLDGTGALVGVIMQQGLEYAGDPAALFFGPAVTAETMQALREEYGLDEPDNLLPLFDAVAFATFHGDDATYLVLALAFPPGADTARAIRVLESKLPEYQSVVTERSLADRWALDRSGTVEVGGVPVAVVAMRIDDPVPEANGASPMRIAVLSWYDLVLRRDLLFLAMDYLTSDAGAD